MLIHSTYEEGGAHDPTGTYCRNPSGSSLGEASSLRLPSMFTPFLVRTALLFTKRLLPTYPIHYLSVGGARSFFYFLISDED
jgi:hypothetical protein